MNALSSCILEEPRKAFCVRINYQKRWRIIVLCEIDLIRILVQRFDIIREMNFIMEKTLYDAKKVGQLPHRHGFLSCMHEAIWSLKSGWSVFFLVENAIWG